MKWNKSFWIDNTFDLPQSARDDVAQIVGAEFVESVIGACRLYLAAVQNYQERPSLKKDVAPAMREFVAEVEAVEQQTRALGNRIEGLAYMLLDMPQPALDEIRGSSLEQQQPLNWVDGPAGYSVTTQLQKQGIELSRDLLPAIKEAARISALLKESPLHALSGKGRPPGGQQPDKGLVFHLATIFFQATGKWPWRTVNAVTGAEEGPLNRLIMVLDPFLNCGPLTRQIKNFIEWLKKTDT